MKRSLTLIGIGAAILGLGGEATARCLEAGKPESVQGVLQERTFQNAGGEDERAYILDLPAPACLVGAEEEDNKAGVLTIHLFSNGASIKSRLQHLAGSAVDARGNPFGALTMHHHAPIVMDVQSIVAATPATKASADAAEFIGPSGNPKPAYTKERNPTAQQLIETWRASNEFMPGKRVSSERFKVADRRVVWGKFGRAFLQFQILSPEGDARAFAMSRCPGRTEPVVIQVFYLFSNDLSAWVPMSTRGDASEDLCTHGNLWNAEQIEYLINPPPLPIPPKVSPSEVVTPQPGSPERAAIMDALRPRYEELFGKPVVFKVETLRTAAGFAFLTVHPQRPDGSPIEKRIWDKALGEPCFQDPAGAVHEYWTQLRDGVWTVGLKNNMCSDDSIASEGDLIGAPPQLVGKPEWPEREFFPEPE